MLVLKVFVQATEWVTMEGCNKTQKIPLLPSFLKMEVRLGSYSVGCNILTMVIAWSLPPQCKS